ncbi:MAG: hypothetical protein HY696_02490 [Deltaproteobacteria bacterium]|nr:hypothetical protein [Deltaproteobacteria bacterium]
MAIHDKYTWADFLKANPDKKGVKRTSPEGAKAFQQAYKAFIQTYLKQRLDRLGRQQTKTTGVRDALVGKLKATKKAAVARRIQTRVGQKDHALVVITKTIGRTKELQKQF